MGFCLMKGNLTVESLQELALYLWCRLDGKQFVWILEEVVVELDDLISGELVW